MMRSWIGWWIIPTNFTQTNLTDNIKLANNGNKHIPNAQGRYLMFNMFDGTNCSWLKILAIIFFYIFAVNSFFSAKTEEMHYYYY